jgi:hypothetical protein
MNRAGLYVDRVLRGVTGPESGDGSSGVVFGIAVVIVSGGFYGLVMGAFGGFGGDRPLQMIFVLNSLLGLRSDFAEAIRALAVTQTAVAVILASLAPYTALWYASTMDYHEATLFNAAMFAIASVAAQWVLRRRYVPLIARDPRHRVMVRVWLAMYAFVGIQMGWVLRPFIGQPDRPVTFFREEAWGNAYIVILETAWTVFSRR